jgi:ribosomal protein S18 acetylase RimI-like enzyme
VTVTGPLAITPLQPADVDAVVGLWERCGLTRPWNDPRADIALALRGANSTVLIGKEADAVVATVMVGHDGHRGWFYYLGVDPACQGRGFGRAITTAAEDWLKVRGLLKAELLIRPDNTKVRGFYASLGYNVEPRTIMTKWLDGRAPTP